MGWVLVGGVVGAAAALLLAPTSGKKTRETIAQGLRTTRDSIGTLTQDLAEKARGLVGMASEMGDRAAAFAEQASEGLHEVVDATEHKARRASRT